MNARANGISRFFFLFFFISSIDTCIVNRSKRTFQILSLLHFRDFFLKYFVMGQNWIKENEATNPSTYFQNLVSNTLTSFMQQKGKNKPSSDFVCLLESHSIKAIETQWIQTYIPSSYHWFSFSFIYSSHKRNSSALVIITFVFNWTKENKHKLIYDIRMR